jgi:rod shape-determining protein MreC
MPLGTLDRTPPPFFKQGQSALSKLMIFSALALFLMVADVRFKFTQVLRAGIATALYPVQWLVMRPVEMARGGGAYFDSLASAQSAAQSAQKRLAAQAQRAAQVEQLGLENDRLRKLMELRSRPGMSGQAAEVMYDKADPYTRRVLVDKGQMQGLKLGSPVLDDSGVLGQITRLYPLSAEVTLLIDREHTIPVLNTRTGARSVVYGDPSQGGTLELRFMAGNADVQQGDVLSTSGVDGVYPAGLPVAKVDKVERRADSAFAKIFCQALANTHGAKHVLVIDPVNVQIPLPPVEDAATTGKKGAKR